MKQTDMCTYPYNAWRHQCLILDSFFVVVFSTISLYKILLPCRLWLISQERGRGPGIPFVTHIGTWNLEKSLHPIMNVNDTGHSSLHLTWTDTLSLMPLGQDLSSKQVCNPQHVIDRHQQDDVISISCCSQQHTSNTTAHTHFSQLQKELTQIHREQCKAQY